MVLTTHSPSPCLSLSPSFRKGREQQPRPLYPLLLFQPPLGATALTWPQAGATCLYRALCSPHHHSPAPAPAPCPRGTAALTGAELPVVRAPAFIKGRLTCFCLQTARHTFYALTLQNSVKKALNGTRTLSRDEAQSQGGPGPPAPALCERTGLCLLGPGAACCNVDSSCVAVTSV